MIYNPSICSFITINKATLQWKYSSAYIHHICMHCYTRRRDARWFRVSTGSCLPLLAQTHCQHLLSKFEALRRGMWLTTTIARCCLRSGSWLVVGWRWSSRRMKQCLGRRWSSPWTVWDRSSVLEILHSPVSLSSLLAEEFQWYPLRTWSEWSTKKGASLDPSQNLQKLYIWQKELAFYNKATIFKRNQKKTISYNIPF